jgi:hypothetical protein
MDTRELIAKLEATQDEADALTRRLIEDLKEHATALEAIDRLEMLRLDQRAAAIAIGVETHVTLIDMRRRAFCRKLFSFREAV